MIKAIVFSKYDDIFEIFIKQYVKTQNYPLTVFDDSLNKGIKTQWHNFQYIDSVKNDNGSFNFTKTMNKALQSFPNDDILFYSDDCYIHTLELHKILSNVAYREPFAGFVVPTMTNVWCALQRNENDRAPWAGQEYIILPDIEGKVYSHHDISTVCFFIKREVINRVGFFDETFIGMGEYSDLDYSIRIRQAGYKNIIVQTCFVEHGGEHFNTLDHATCNRATSIERRNYEQIKNSAYFIQKWKLN